MGKNLISIIFILGLKKSNKIDRCDHEGRKAPSLVLLPIIVLKKETKIWGIQLIGFF